MAATTAAESTPPERKAPYGTSDIIWRSTASVKRSASWPATSSSERSRWGAPGGARQVWTRGWLACSTIGGELVDAPEEGARGGDEAAGEVVVEGGAVDLGCRNARLEQGADLGGDRHSGAVAPPVQGLDAEIVAGGDEPLPVLVPEDEGEDAVELADALGAALLVGVDDGLGVGVRGEAVAALLESGAKGALVVDLAVDDDGDGAVLGVERLVAPGDVDDGEPGVGERGGAGAPDPLAVGPAVPKRLEHPLGGVLAQGASRVEERADAAHQSWLALPPIRAAILAGRSVVTFSSRSRLEPSAAAADHRPPLHPRLGGRTMYRLMGRIHAALAAARREAGQGTVEYVALILLVALVMAGVIAAMKGFRTDEGKELGDAIIGKIKEAVRKVQF